VPVEAGAWVGIPANVAPHPVAVGKQYTFVTPEPVKSPDPVVGALPRNVRNVSFVLLANTASPRLITAFGIARLVNEVQALKALVPIVVSVVGSSTDVRDMQERNALPPMLVIPDGTVMAVSEVLDWNALLPIAVTGTPLIAAGIVIAPPAPV
jgi:hypothetical protein